MRHDIYIMLPKLDVDSVVLRPGRRTGIYLQAATVAAAALVNMGMV